MSRLALSSLCIAVVLTVGISAAPVTKQCDICSADKAEYCEVFPENTRVCNDPCGFEFDEATKRCWEAGTAPVVGASNGKSAPVIGGQGKFKYQWMPELLQMPGASLVNCHGLVTDKASNIYLTYQNDGKDKNCLIRWKPDGTGGEFMTGPAGSNVSTLCAGTPHGLKIKEENGEEVLYHANNNMKLTKTKLDGTVIWQREGLFGQDTTVYRPTWHSVPPNSDFTYLCDGYGSNNVYEFDTEGNFLNKTWGGPSKIKGPTAELGKFSTNHGCTYDPRIPDTPTVVVSDRANSRFQLCEIDPKKGGKFDCRSSINMQPYLGKQSLPCNLRMYPKQEGRAITPDLAGPVGVLDESNKVISIVNVSDLLAVEQHKHPHDAIFLPNGDMVVATWAPGRISYWKRLPSDNE